MRSTRLVASITVCLLLLCAKTILAQVELDCVTLVEQSLTDFGANCRDLASGMLCYGHKAVQAETNTSNGAILVNPADQVAINTVASVSALVSRSPQRQPVN